MGRVNNRKWNGAHILILRKLHSTGKSSHMGVTGGTRGGEERGKLLKQLYSVEESYLRCWQRGSLSTKAPPDFPFPVEDLGYTFKVDWLLRF